MNTTINGLSVNSYGEKSNKGVVFVHGFPLNQTMWKNQVEALQNDYFVVTYDLRGLGESETGDGQYTMEQNVDDLFTVIDELELKKPVVCGLSMGGYITLAALARDFHRFSAAVLLDTRAEADDDAGKLKRQNAIKKVNEEGVVKFGEDFMKNILDEKRFHNQDAVYKGVYQMVTKQKPLGVKGALIAMLSRQDNNGLLEELTIPVLAMGGERDRLTPPDVMQKMANKIAKGEYVPVPGAAHLAPYENPEFVNSVLLDFLAKN